jgi:hypothetical protein
MIIDTSILSTRSHTVDFYNPDTTDKFQKCEIEGKNWITRALIFDRKLDQLLLKDSQTLILTPCFQYDSADITEDTILEQRLFQLFSDNFGVVLDFSILEDEYNIRTLAVNIKFICTRCETGQKSFPDSQFSTCF